MTGWDIAGEPPLRLELLTPRHERALKHFELTNRAFFARHVSDRGDDYFAQFAQRLTALVQENDTGRSLCCVVVRDADVVARVNVLDIDSPGATELGFRVAESAQGSGVATRSVRTALTVAAELGVTSVFARAATANLGSQRVLRKCGFEAAGAVEPPAGVDATFVGFRWTPSSTRTFGRA